MNDAHCRPLRINPLIPSKRTTSPQGHPNDTLSGFSAATQKQFSVVNPNSLISVFQQRRLRCVG